MDMTAEDFREARRTLGLTQPQLAAMLGVSVRQVKGMEAEKDALKRRIAPWHARLIAAYLAGYRPADWPLKSG